MTNVDISSKSCRYRTYFTDMSSNHIKLLLLNKKVKKKLKKDDLLFLLVPSRVCKGYFYISYVINGFKTKKNFEIAIYI